MAIWKFKRGQRAKGFAMVEDTVADLVRKTKGFRGNLTLLSIDDPLSGVVITMWRDEESEKAFAEGVFKLASRKLKPFVVGPPDVKHYRVFSAELKH